MQIIFTFHYYHSDNDILNYKWTFYCIFILRERTFQVCDYFILRKNPNTFFQSTIIASSFSSVFFLWYVYT